MLLFTALTATDTAFNAIDWTREALTTLGYWQNANSRRAIAFLESDGFHQFIRHAARGWVMACLLVRFVATLLTSANAELMSASDDVVAEMEASAITPIKLSSLEDFRMEMDYSFTGANWPQEAEKDLAALNGYVVA